MLNARLRRAGADTRAGKGREEKPPGRTPYIAPRSARDLYPRPHCNPHPNNRSSSA